MVALSSPEIINLQPNEINPFMCSCDIRICYTGLNRNGSYFSKEVLAEMAKSLRGSPIVGAFNREIGDFTDHGEELVIDEQGIQVQSTTVPYGFVAPNASVWFQTFQEKDLTTGQSVEREYLMTTGYLWVKQFEASQSVIDSGIKGQSMEIDRETLQGRFEKLVNGKSIFIVTDANFTKLCILGDDVEPCFETAAVIPKQIASYNYNKIQESDITTNSFAQTLYSMMQELKDILNKEGGEQMVKNTDVEKSEEEIKTEFDKVVEDKPTAETTENLETFSEFKKDEDKEDDKDETDDKNDNKKEQNDADDTDDDEKKKKETYTADSDEKVNAEIVLLKNQLADTETKFQELQNKFEKLTNDYEELVSFQNKVMDEKKDALINKFFTLSDEDKKEVIENKSKYSLDEIEAKLSIIYTRNSLKAQEREEMENKSEETEVDEKVSMTFNVQEQSETVPGFLSALRAHKNNL
jgi:hypothetical protein